MGFLRRAEARFALLSLAWHLLPLEDMRFHEAQSLAGGFMGTLGIGSVVASFIKGRHGDAPVQQEPAPPKTPAKRRKRQGAG
jgi:hypothetical protein